MNTNKVYEKYRDDINSVAIANGDVDIIVAENMVRSICQVRLGIIPPEINYAGLREDFPCEEYLKDFVEEAAETAF